MKRNYLIIAVISALSIFSTLAIAGDYPVGSAGYSLSMDYGSDLPTILLDLQDMDFGTATVNANHETRDTSRDRLPVMLPAAPDIHAFRLSLKQPWQYQRK